MAGIGAIVEPLEDPLAAADLSVPGGIFTDGLESWSSVSVVLIVVFIFIALTAREASGIVGIAESPIPRDLWIRAEGSSQPDGVGRGSIVDIFRGDHSRWRNSVLDPSFERCLHIVNRIARGRDLLPDASEARRPGPEVAMSHSRNHEEPIEPLRPAQATHGCDDRLVVLGAVGRLKCLVVPSVILDDLHTSPPCGGKVRIDRIAWNSNLEVGVRHVGVEIEGAVIPVLIFEYQIGEVALPQS